MKVAVYYKNDDVRIEDMPRPILKHGEILIKMHASGVCGSDVMEWYRIKKAPRVLGHEMTGEIVEVSNVDRYKPGQRVFVSHHVPCNKCHYCQSNHHTACETLHTTNYDPGGFAEFIRVPSINVESGVYPLPDNVSYEEGTFIEPLACVMRGQRLADVTKDQTALIIGSGISGLLHIQLAKLRGAKVIATDICEQRMEYAKMFGADHVLYAKELNPDKLRGLNNGLLADCVIICSGALNATKQALESVERGGKILFFAVPKPGFNLEVPINDFWRDEVTIMTSYGAAPRDLDDALLMIKSEKIDLNKMITHKFKLDDAQQAFKLVAEGKESIKVILTP